MKIRMRAAASFSSPRLVIESLQLPRHKTIKDIVGHTPNLGGKQRTVI